MIVFTILVATCARIIQYTSDMTASKHLNQQQQQQQHNNTVALMEHFVAKLQHDMMTPSNTVLSVHISARLLLRQGCVFAEAFHLSDDSEFFAC